MKMFKMHILNCIMHFLQFVKTPFKAKNIP